MTANEYRIAIAQLGLSQVAASRLLGVDPRTSRRWASGERTIAEPAARFLRYLVATGADHDAVLQAVVGGTK